MKKLLSLLSVLTISGTAVPTTIAASSYQKDTSSTCGFDVKDKKPTINNLKKLNRNKRNPVNEGCKNGLKTIGISTDVGAASGAAIGAGLGSVIPGAGTIAGAGFGAAVGGLYEADAGSSLAGSNAYC